jgi:hypothetical protein
MNAGVTGMTRAWRLNFLIAPRSSLLMDDVWDSSSWMAEEASFGIERSDGARIQNAFYWNPDMVTVAAAGMVGYLKEALPIGLDQAVAVLRQRLMR